MENEENTNFKNEIEECAFKLHVWAMREWKNSFQDSNGHMRHHRIMNLLDSLESVFKDLLKKEKIK